MNSSTKILKSRIADVQTALGAMETNEEFEVSPRQFVEAVYPQIKSALEDKRQNFEAISERIAQHGISMSPRSLRTHFNAITKTNGNDNAVIKKRYRKGSNPKGTASSQE